MIISRKIRVTAAASIALGMVSSPAIAKDINASALGLGKTEAILGGSSSLAAILAQQGATRPQTAYAQLAPRSSQLVDVRPAVSEFAADKPNIFGTVALRVKSTPLDARWHKVQAAKVTGRAAQFATSLARLNEISRLQLVNRYVNRRISFAEDSQVYRHPDVWRTANSSLNTGRGDCEDYAIAKLQMLRAAGFSDRDLYLVVLKDVVRRSDHAVVVVRTGQHMVMLDNGADDVFDTESVSDYRPIMTFSAYGAWTHGYRVRSAPIEVASVSGGAPVPAAQPLETAAHRSRNASLLAFNTGFNR